MLPLRRVTRQRPQSGWLAGSDLEAGLASCARQWDALRMAVLLGQGKKLRRDRDEKGVANA
jgi:hypothetical protein